MVVVGRTDIPTRLLLAQFYARRVALVSVLLVEVYGLETICLSRGRHLLLATFRIRAPLIEIQARLPVDLKPLLGAGLDGLWAELYRVAALLFEALR